MSAPAVQALTSDDVSPPSGQSVLTCRASHRGSRERRGHVRNSVSSNLVAFGFPVPYPSPSRSRNAIQDLSHESQSRTRSRSRSRNKCWEPRGNRSSRSHRYSGASLRPASPLPPGWERKDVQQDAHRPSGGIFYNSDTQQCCSTKPVLARGVPENWLKDPAVVLRLKDGTENVVAPWCGKCQTWWDDFHSDSRTHGASALGFQEKGDESATGSGDVTMRHEPPGLQALSAAHVASIDELFVEADVWEVAEAGQARKMERTKRQYSRASRLVQFYNKDKPRSDQIGLCLARLPCGEKLRALFELARSGSPIIEDGSHVMYVFAPIEGDNKKEAAEVWLLSLPRGLPHGSAFVEDILSTQGDFHLEVNPIKRASRIELLLSCTVPTAENYNLKRIRDIERNGYKFTDGCGMISERLLDQVKKRFFELTKGQFTEDMEKQFKESTGVQIRVLGYKGVVVVNPDLDGLELQLPDSMRKFSVHGVDRDLEIGKKVEVKGIPIEVVDFAVVSERARIARQIMQVLEARCPGACEEILQSSERQLCHLAHLVENPSVRDYLDVLMGGRRHSNDEAICRDKLLAGFDPRLDTHLQWHIRTYAEQQTRSLAKGVPLRKAWYAMQVPDWTQQLPEGTAYVPWLASEADECQEIFIVFGKSPMYELGNLRKVRLVGPKKYPKLGSHRGYMILSTQGDRPEQDKAFGSDNDGDKPLIIANPACVPPDVSPEPQDYRMKEQRSFATTPRSLAACIVDYVEANLDSCLGLLDSALMTVAAQGREKMMTQHYQALARMFAQEVDACKTGRHVPRQEIDKLRNLALGYHDRAKISNIPSFLAYDADFKAKQITEDRRVIRPDTLVGKVFEAAKDRFERLASHSERCIVKALDPDLLKSWDQLEASAGGPGSLLSLLQRATRVRREFEKSNSEFKRDHPKQKDMSQYRSCVRQVLKEAGGTTITPHAQFLRRERQRIEDAARELGVDVFKFALALYIEKYSELLPDKLDRTAFPWNLVTEELIHWKKGERPQFTATQDVFRALCRPSRRTSSPPVGGRARAPQLRTPHQ